MLIAVECNRKSKYPREIHDENKGNISNLSKIILMCCINETV